MGVVTGGTNWWGWGFRGGFMIREWDRLNLNLKIVMNLVLLLCYIRVGRR